jgi:hypothetical protein
MCKRLAQLRDDPEGEILVFDVFMPVCDFAGEQILLQFL